MRISILPALCAALVLAAATTAHAQEAVTIKVEVLQSVWSSGGGPSYVGDFVASGGISDEGSVALYATYGYWLYLRGVEGEITIVFHADGWYVAAGTGAYEDLQGEGTLSSESYLVPNPWAPGTYLWGIRFSMTGTVELVENVLPTADLVVESVSGMTVVLSAAGSSDPDRSIVAYEWDMDDDGIYEHWTTYSDIQHTFGATGTYLVTVRVTDDRGGTDSATASVTVQAPAPPPDEGKGGGKDKGAGKGKKK
ncbi:MAG: PKD domain-containing protein [Planctomycetota bacterium]|jgi:PKD repeat protein